MIKIRSERANLKKKMEDEVRRFIQELENNVEVARARERAIQESLSEQQVKNAEQNRFEIQLRELELEAEGNRQIYETFLSRFKATTNQDTIQQSDARIISEATVPQSASFPNRRLFVVVDFCSRRFWGWLSRSSRNAWTMASGQLNSSKTRRHSKFGSRSPAERIRQEQASS